MKVHRIFMVTGTNVVVLPFPITTNNSEMEKAIDRYDSEKYKKQLDEFQQGIGLVFDGNASETLVKFIQHDSK